MTFDTRACIWPDEQLPDLIRAVAELAGLPVKEVAMRRPSGSSSGNPLSEPDRRVWVEEIGAAFGLETDSGVVLGQEIARQMRQAVPAVFQIPGQGWLGAAAASAGRIRLVLPDGSVRKVAWDDLARTILQAQGGRYRDEIERMVEECGTTAGRAGAGRRALLRERLLRERLTDKRVATAWPLRLPAGSSFWKQARQAGLVRRLAALAGAHTAQYCLWLLSWWVLGRGALSGQFDRGWIAAWILLLLTMVPLRWLTAWSQGVTSVTLGGLLKQRLMAGALRLEPDHIRADGAGQSLGRVMESDTVESLALGGGIAALLSACELTAAAVVLALGAGGLPHAALLSGFIALTVFLGWRRAPRLAWTTQRLHMTHRLVENMSGHRTRLAQQPREQWHTGEDRDMQRYTELSRRLDSDIARAIGLVPQGWLIVGLLGLAPVFLAPQAQTSQTALAIGLGGVLLAQGSLKRLVTGLGQVAGAEIAWKRVAPLFDAAATPLETGEPDLALRRSEGNVALDARDLGFRYPGRVEPVLRSVNLRIFAGNRVLLEGASGGGKSSLVAVLAGLRKPTSGVVLAGGLDRPTLGARGWRRRVAAAPQPHENHIFAGSLAFNLLLGRCWPASQADLAEAEAVCRELGLGPLLERMPAGLQQMVGNTGWLLSQGERGRVFLARALLQESDIAVLDESFAALDPETLQVSLTCAFRRARTLIVAGHP